MAYGVWTTSTFLALLPSLIRLFLANPGLKDDWGLPSKATFLQPFIHMFIVVQLEGYYRGIDSIISKSLALSFGTVVGGWVAGSLLILTWNIPKIIIILMY